MMRFVHSINPKIRETVIINDAINESSQIINQLYLVNIPNNWVQKIIYVFGSFIFFFANGVILLAMYSKVYNQSHLNLISLLFEITNEPIITISFLIMLLLIEISCFYAMKIFGFSYNLSKWSTFDPIMMLGFST